MQGLLEKVCDLLQNKYEFLRSLANLRVFELRKINNANHLVNVTSVDQLVKNHHQSISSFLPLKGLVKEAIKANDHIVVCNIDSTELWIKFKMIMRCSNRQLEAEFEIKVEKKMSGQSFH